MFVIKTRAVRIWNRRSQSDKEFTYCLTGVNVSSNFIGLYLPFRAKNLILNLNFVPRPSYSTSIVEIVVRWILAAGLFLDRQRMG